MVAGLAVPDAMGLETDTAAALGPPGGVGHSIAS